MHAQTLGDDLAHRHARATGCRTDPGTRSASRDRSAPHRARGPVLVDIRARRTAIAALHVLQPQHRQRQRGLARAGFADQANRLALAHRQTDTPSTARTWPTVAAQHAAADREMHLHIIRFAAAARRSFGSGAGRASRHGSQQHARVRMRRRGEHFGDRARPPRSRRPSSRTPGRHSGGRCRRSWVISSSARPRAAFSSREQRQDLRLDRHVERGGRLVGDQQCGSLASAMAIMTRWRWPPESWCGNASSRCSASGKPAWSSTSIDAFAQLPRAAAADAA